MRIGQLSLLAVALLLPQGARADATLALTGPPSVVFDAARDGCEPNDVPDVNPRAFRDAAGRVAMFALHFVNRPLRGPDLHHLAIDCRVALGSPFDPDPAHYADRNFIAATWTTDGAAVSALVHHEYHADQHGRCTAQGDLACWYNSVLAYRSRDGGVSFAKASPLVVAAPPFTQDVGQGRHRGFFNPSNIVTDGRYEYVFASTTGWDGQPFGNCLLRTPDPANSALWRAFDGTGFTIRYGDPYRARQQPGSCATIAPFAYAVGSVTRHRASGLWLAVFQAAAGGAFPASGFYYSTATDLLHWSAPRLLLAAPTLYDDLCKAGPAVVGYPALLDWRAPGRNFDEVGDDPELFFTSMEVKNCRTGARLLLRRTVHLQTGAAR